MHETTDWKKDTKESTTPFSNAQRRRKPVRSSETTENPEPEDTIDEDPSLPDWDFPQAIKHPSPEETANEHMALVVSRVIKDMVDDPEVQEPDPRYYESSIHDGAGPEKVHNVFKSSTTMGSTTSPTGQN